MIETVGEDKRRTSANSRKQSETARGLLGPRCLSLPMHKSPTGLTQPEGVKKTSEVGNGRKRSEAVGN
eukprot:5206435-Karenia_brevis.AAC.1